jgi:hypothetical protein
MICRHGKSFQRELSVVLVGKFRYELIREAVLVMIAMPRCQTT